MKPKNQKLMRYFRNTMPLMIAGAVLIAAGLAIYYYSFEIWALGTPILAVGAVLLVLGFTLKVSDQSYAAYFQDKVTALKASEPSYETAPDYTSDEFTFEGNKFAKTDSAGKPRSELFTHADLRFIKDKKSNTLDLRLYNINAADDTAEARHITFDMAKVTAKSQDKEITCAGLKRAVTTLTLDDGENKAEIPLRTTISKSILWSGKSMTKAGCKLIACRGRGRTLKSPPSPPAPPLLLKLYTN